MMQGRTGRLLALAVAAMFAVAQVPATALADGRGHGRHHGGYDRNHDGGYQKHRGHGYKRRGVVIVRPGHRRHYDARRDNGRRYGKHRHDNRHYDHRPRHRGYAHRPAHRHYRGHRGHDDAFVLFGLGLATVGLFAILNQSQRQAHHRTQVYATTAPIGRTITWDDGGAGGSVVVTRDGRDQSGRYCREYQHTVTVAGRQQQAWGTACQQPDGDWQIIE
ncbi:MAG: hypothetical protein RIM84_16455 [Alphaproteobacteria bacterium]